MRIWRRDTAVRLLAWMLAGAGLTPALVHGAEFLEYYKAGLAAVEARQWERAADLMQQAITEQPEAKARVSRSLFFRRYLPHFYLGKARFERGDCRGAVTAWRESERQGVVTRFPEFQEIQEGRAACQQISELQLALERALRVLADVEAAAAESRRRISMLEPADAASRALVDRQIAAEADLGRARLQIESSDVVLDVVELVAVSLATTATEFEAIEQLAANRRQVQTEQRREAAVALLQELNEKARRELVNSEYLRPYPPELSRRRQELVAVLERSTTAGVADLGVGEIETVQGELERTVRGLRQAMAPPPAALGSAAKAFLQRDYRRVLDALDEPDLVSVRVNLQAHLLRAAALYSLYQATGRVDESLTVAAAEEVVACHRADPQWSPPAAVFSPDFLAFFAERAAAAAADGIAGGADTRGSAAVVDRAVD